jgi:hypothetical protein
MGRSMLGTIALMLVGRLRQGESCIPLHRKQHPRNSAEVPSPGRYHLGDCGCRFAAFTQKNNATNLLASTCITELI